MKFLIFFSALVFMNISFANNFFSEEDSIVELKKEIVALAQSFEGQGDPSFSKQRKLEKLITILIDAYPQPPIIQRKNLLVGVWKQVWGPYDYRKDDRGVDPELGINEIYQVVFRDGYYYNVSPLYKNGDLKKERIGLLRGQYTFDKKDPNTLNVEFTSYKGSRSRPTDINLWDLAALAEDGTLENQITIVPTLVVRWFFSSGSLREVYTDKDLRILYGSDGRNFEKDYLYVMTKVK